MCSRVFFTPPILPILAVAIGVCAVLATVSPSAATQFTYDPFLIGTNPSAGEYTEGLIAGQNPSTGSFFTGPWLHDVYGSVTENGSVLADGLSYLRTPAPGGSAGWTLERASSSDEGDYYRALAEPWDDDTEGTWYISYVVNFGAMAPDNPHGDMGYRAIMVTGFDGWIGYNAYYSDLGMFQRVPSTGRMVFGFGPDQIIENSPMSFNQDGITHLVVLKFEMSNVAASDAVSVYLDPVTTTEPELAGASVSGIDFAMNAIQYALYGSYGGTDPIWDEIRVGDTFFDVLPEIPVPGDTDNDHDVDLDDYATILAHLNQEVAGGPSEGDVALANGTQGSDGRVTLGDFWLWKDNETPPPGAGSLAGPASVPEPSTVILALAAAIALAGYARARRRAA